MGSSLKSRRLAAGLSQRALARRAGVAFRTVQLLEGGGHDARRSTLEKLERALGPAPASDLAGVLAAAQRGAFESWKLHLPEFVDAFRRAPSRRLVEAAPAADVDPRLLALGAACVERLCAEHGLAAPLWCAGTPGLPEPWFPSGAESLKASALAESPAAFRRRNVFVLGNFLERA